MTRFPVSAVVAERLIHRPTSRERLGLALGGSAYALIYLMLLAVLLCGAAAMAATVTWIATAA